MIVLKSRKTIALTAFLAVSVVTILIVGVYYVLDMKQSLWQQSVSDILEVTTQGRHALDTYIDKDTEALHWLAEEMSKYDSDQESKIYEKLNLSPNTDTSSFICVNQDSGRLYDTNDDKWIQLEGESWTTFNEMDGTGIREPFLSGRTGVWSVSCYETFTFTDGVRGVVQKTVNCSEISKSFSLSFYDDTGFSYVINKDGEILIRSQHRNSNRTFKNIFDIIDVQGNDEETVKSFAQALKDDKKGAARFKYQDADYVFCYVPMASADGWYVVSIVPDQTIMEEAEMIIHNSQVFVFMIILGVLIMIILVLISRNSSHRIVAAEEKARRAAESANLAKSRFLSNMSHDIRTPMNAVVGMTALALDHVEEPEKVRGYLNYIDQSGKMLVSLINDVLDLSKIESGEMELNNSDNSLNSLMNKLKDILEPMADQRDQNLEFSFHNVDHDSLCFDELRLNQVLINLLSNALKFTPDGGRITMDVTESQSQYQDSIHLTFCVTDTGVGMKQDFIEYIFDSFTREQDSRINKKEGSGLGMAIAKQIVDLMGGTIQVESQPGKGSVFTVELDILRASQPINISEGDSDDAADMVSIAGKHILLAEDNNLNQMIVEEILSDLGAEIETVGDGKSCIERFARSECGEFDLILMDINMPVMNGYEAARQIRNMDRADAVTVPVFAMTADAFTEDIEEAKRAGMNAHLSKPLDIQHMMREIKKYI